MSQTRIGRLKARHQFLKIANEGHKAVTKSFVIFCCFDFISTQRDVFQKNDILIGYTATKKVGNAVKRNRMKRRLRAMMYESFIGDFNPVFQKAGFVVIARHNAFKTPYAEMKAELSKCANWLRKQAG